MEEGYELNRELKSHWSPTMYFRKRGEAFEQVCVNCLLGPDEIKLFLCELMAEADIPEC